MTDPYYTNKVIRGYIEAGTVTSTSVGNVRILYDSQVYIISGSTITLSSPLGTTPTAKIITGEEVPPIPPLPDGTIRIGYEVTPTRRACPAEKPR
jgi:hypothetical protein